MWDGEGVRHHSKRASYHTLYCSSPGASDEGKSAIQRGDPSPDLKRSTEHSPPRSTSAACRFAQRGAKEDVVKLKRSVSSGAFHIDHGTGGLWDLLSAVSRVKESLLETSKDLATGIVLLLRDVQ